MKVRVDCLGKDAEHWAGNYGTLFRNEKLYLTYRGSNFPERKIASDETSKVSPVNFSCNFNFGRGSAYFIDGRKVLEHKWANLCEFDFSLANHNCTDGGVYWPTFTGEHWNGGSSLKLNPGVHKLQNFFKVQGKTNLRIVYKGSVDEICGVKVNPKTASNGWSIFQSEIDYPEILFLKTGQATLGHISLVP